jgi:hypothetical protein
VRVHSPCLTLTEALNLLLTHLGFGVEVEGDAGGNS